MKTDSPMNSAYDPKAIEAGWFARWEAARLFTADPASTKPKYSIAVPPPNVTGELHMGHALNGTLQDVCCRYRRMTGHEVLWVPGMDHAAIATQNVIERRLASEGTSKEEIGRAAFAELVEEWYRSVGATIVLQFKELGASLDYSRIRFTMDEAYVRAVRTAFVHFWEKGWLYRGPRIVNWCPRCQSAISDLEVEWREHADNLYRIRYPLDGEPAGEVVIATVRPETMLMDSGVAVHPEDERYRALVGRNAVLPLVGRLLPIVADPAVERGFGTGALKVTPGHDPLDYELGQRHHLQLINGMHPDGRLNVPFAPQFDGLPSLEARDRVVEALKAEGALVGVDPYTHQVGHCDRCGTVLEPLVSEQWFLSMGELARNAIAASERGEVRWHPERYERTYLDWLRGIRDWNVSRQLWLGHPIPVYTCPDGHLFAAVDPPESCRECGKSPLAEDPDVLDTWFSSALWPFATLGWPEKTPDLEAFYPTSMNSTAREIINLWVSRMIMTGLEFMGRVPFGDVAIHCVVQTADGQRMSKSKGNVIDPREIVAQYGADALRAWAASVAMSTQDVRFDESRIEGYRRFSNKLWNATRLVVGSLGADPVAHPVPGAELALLDRWILSRLQATIAEVTRGIEEFEFQAAIGRLYDFAWGEFCDWYLEGVKPRLRDGDHSAQAVMVMVLDSFFRLLHPFMPFVSEELWHRLPGERDFLLRAAWPELEAGFEDPAAEARIAALMAGVEEIRRVRSLQKAPPRGGHLVLAGPAAGTGGGQGFSEDERELISSWAQVELAEALAQPGTETVLGTVAFPSARGGVQRDAELRKLTDELAKVEAKLANQEFRSRAPAAVVEKEEQKAEDLRAQLRRLG